MNMFTRAAWQSGPNEISVTVPRADGDGEYRIRLPRAEAETMAAETFAALLEDHQSDAGADR